MCTENLTHRVDQTDDLSLRLQQMERTADTLTERMQEYSRQLTEIAARTDPRDVFDAFQRWEPSSSPVKRDESPAKRNDDSGSDMGVVEYRVPRRNQVQELEIEKLETSTSKVDATTGKCDSQAAQKLNSLQDLDIHAAPQENVLSKRSYGLLEPSLDPKPEGQFGSPAVERSIESSVLSPELEVLRCSDEGKRIELDMLSPELEVFRCSEEGKNANITVRQFLSCQDEVSHAGSLLKDDKLTCDRLSDVVPTPEVKKDMSEVVSEGEIEMSARRPNRLADAAWRHSVGSMSS